MILNVLICYQLLLQCEDPQLLKQVEEMLSLVEKENYKEEGEEEEEEEEEEDGKNNDDTMDV